MTEWQSQKSEMSGELKGVCQKYENDLKLLSMQLEEEKEKAVDYEIQLREKVAILEENEDKWMAAEAQYKQMLATA